jgi:hypothetical protein
MLVVERKKYLGLIRHVTKDKLKVCVSLLGGRGACFTRAVLLRW